MKRSALHAAGVSTVALVVQASLLEVTDPTARVVLGLAACVVLWAVGYFTPPTEPNKSDP